MHTQGSAVRFWRRRGRASILGACAAVVGILPFTDPGRDVMEQRHAWAQESAWHAAAPMREARLSHCAAPLADGRVLVVGGATGPSHSLNRTRTAEIYDSATDTWAPAAAMTDEGGGCFTLTLPDSRVLVGIDSSRGYQAEVYDAGSDTWSPVRPPHGHWAFWQVALASDGRVLALTFDRDAGGQLPELYDPAQDTWTAAVPPTLTSVHGLVRLVDGRMLAYGSRPRAAGSTSRQPAVEIYDPAAGAWTGTEPPDALLTADSVVVLADGRVLWIDNAQLYDPATGAWSAIGELMLFSYAHVLLPDGRVLASGGPLFSTDEQTAHLYDPATGRWSCAPSLLEPRMRHTLTLLPNEEVLAVGGERAHGPDAAYASAERYRP
jgi:hypothetical protein